MTAADALFYTHRARFAGAQAACRSRACWSPFPELPAKYPDAAQAQARGLAALSLAARQEEDRVEFTLTWQGSPLPPRARALDPEDLFGDRETQERFLVAMATREAQSFSQRTTPRGCEARLAFDD